MACFIVPATEAVITAVATKMLKNKEQKYAHISLNTNHTEIAEKIPFSRKLKWLTNLLFGGSVLLAFEHIWHGEVVPWFPFLTAVNNPDDLAEMLHEMATVGTAMAVLVTAVWLGMLAVVSIAEKKSATPKTSVEGTQNK